LYNKNSSAISFYTTLIILKKKLLKTLIRFIPGNSLRIILLRACDYKIGKKVYIGEDLIVSEVLEDFSEKLIIEDRVAIAQRVTFVTASDPNYSRLWDYVKIIRGKIIIKHDAWIGVGVIILPNVTIGEFSIVGAGAVVTKDVPPYTIVAGIPAKPIKKIKISGNKDKNES
jgi:maltose O-acetyltransferase